MNKLKYDRVNILAKCKTEEMFQPDMLYNVTTTDRAIKGNMIKFVNFYFNPKPIGNEELYSSIVNRILDKNSYMRDFKVKSIEINFDYSTDLNFNQLNILGKIITDILSKKKFKTLNINANMVEFNYKIDEFQERHKSYKWFKYKSKNSKHKKLEVKLYKKANNLNRFEIIFYNNDCRMFKTLDDSFISSGTRIKLTFQEIYDDIYQLLESDKELWNNEGVAEFMNAFKITLDNMEVEQVA